MMPTRPEEITMTIIAITRAHLLDTVDLSATELEAVRDMRRVLCDANPCGEVWRDMVLTISA